MSVCLNEARRDIRHAVIADFIAINDGRRRHGDGLVDDADERRHVGSAAIDKRRFARRDLTDAL